MKNILLREQTRTVPKIERSEAQRRASAANGKKGGRPKGKRNKD